MVAVGADMAGGQSFKYDDVVKYYRESMNFAPPDQATRCADASPLVQCG